MRENLFFFCRGVKISLRSYLNLIVAISFDTYMPIFISLLLVNSSKNWDKHKKKPLARSVLQNSWDDMYCVIIQGMWKHASSPSVRGLFTSIKVCRIKIVDVNFWLCHHNDVSIIN